jgi:hypothetical protein
MTTKDLGSIGVEAAPQVPGAGAVDVLGPLVQAGAQAVEGLKTGMIDDLTDGLRDATRDAAAETSDVAQEVEEPIAPATDDPAANALISRIKLLQGQVAQTSGSTRLNAQLKIRQAGEELRRKFPRLGDEISAAVRRFESNDPEFFALAAIDAQNESFNKQAAKELDAIWDEAYNSVASGGLGMDPGTQTFGTKEFALAYIAQTQLVVKTEQNRAYLNAVRSTDEVDSRGYAQSWSMMQRGQASGVKAMISKTQAQARAVASAFQDPTAPNAAEIISVWGAPGGGKDLALQNTREAVVALEEAFINHFPTTMRNTEDFKAAESSKNAQVAALNVLIEGINSDSPTLMKAYESYETFQDIEFERNNRMVVQQGRELSRVIPLLEAMKGNFGAKDKIIRNTVSEYLNTTLQGFLGRSQGMAQYDQLPANATNQQLQDNSRSMKAYNPDLYGTGIVTPEGTQTGAITDLQLGSDPRLLDLVKDGDASAIAPDVASEQWIARSSSLDILTNQGALNDGDARLALVAFTADGVLEQATASRRPGGQPNASTFALENAERLFSTQVVENSDNFYARSLGTNVGNGIFFQDAMVVDVSDIEDGVVRVTVDEVKLSELVKEASGISPVTVIKPRGGFSSQRTRNQEARAAATQAKEIARVMQAHLNETMRISGTLEALQVGADEIDWVTAFNKVGAGRFTPGQEVESE